MDEKAFLKIIAYFACFLFLLIAPVGFLNSIPSVCLFKGVFGKSCFGCGITRAISAMVKFHLKEAMGYNKLVVLVFPLLVVIVVRDIFLNIKALLSRNQSLIRENKL